MEWRTQLNVAFCNGSGPKIVRTLRGSLWRASYAPHHISRSTCIVSFAAMRKKRLQVQGQTVNYGASNSRTTSARHVSRENVGGASHRDARMNATSAHRTGRVAIIVNRAAFGQNTLGSGASEALPVAHWTINRTSESR